MGLALTIASGVWAGDETGVAEIGPGQGAPGQFTYAAVVRRASDLASGPYTPDRPDLPDYLANLDAEHYRDIGFDRAESIWRRSGLPFQVQLFPRGFLFKDRVTVNLIEDGKSRPLDFRREFFDYGKNKVPAKMPADLGFAGLRLLYPINRDEVFDEVAVFLGASYFRAVGQNLTYGITSRALAIDTGLPSQEEFPVFREFWVVRPDPDATAITVFALMDSESVVGAYRFLIHPGPETVVDVKAHLAFRRGVQKLGIAPLTSMFLHGETSDRFFDDFRPEVHDSDGLLVETGYGERIWRPLVNPEGLRVSTYAVENPRSFGLLQRDRDFDDYQDLEGQYENRPSALVEPIGKWGKGVIELVEIPSAAERYDNIVAYWIPEQRTSAGQEMDLEYRLHFTRDPEAGLLGGRVTATRIGAGGPDLLDSKLRRLVVDFNGETLARLDPGTNLDAVVTTSSGKLSPVTVRPKPEGRGWRLAFDLDPDGDEPADLRAFLRHGTDVLSETWSFRWVKE